MLCNAYYSSVRLGPLNPYRENEYNGKACASLARHSRCVLVVGIFLDDSHVYIHWMEEITVSNDMEIGNSCAAYSIEYIKMDVPFNIISFNVTLSLWNYVVRPNVNRNCLGLSTASSLTDLTENESATTRRHFTFHDTPEPRTNPFCRLRNDCGVSRLQCSEFIRVFMAK